MKLGLYPKAMGPEFLPVYKAIIEKRLAAKRAKDKTTDKGLKISINGAYGKEPAHPIPSCLHRTCSCP